MHRVKKVKNPGRTVRLTEETYQSLRRLAFDNNTSMGRLVTETLPLLKKTYERQKGKR